MKLHGVGRLVGGARRAVRAGGNLPARRRGLARLDERGDDAARTIAAAVRATLTGGPDTPAQEWIARIEGLRQELLAREDELVVRASEYAAAADDTELIETVGATCRTASRPPVWSRFLLELVRRHDPARGIELGTCLGISAAFQAAGMRLAGGGMLVTLDASEARTTLARENLSRLGLEEVEVVRGRFQETLAPAIERLAPLDYAFVDGHHDEVATQDYFAAIAAHASSGALIVVDDITWSEGMTRAWQSVARHPRTTLAVDLGEMGVCVLDGAGAPETVRAPLR